MLKNYITNAIVLVAFISIIYQIFRSTGLNPSLAVRYRLLSGSIWGLMGVTLIIFGIDLPNNLVVDFRNLAIFLSAISGGWASAILSAIIISVFRLLYFGINPPSIATGITIIILVVVFCIIAGLKIKNRMKWLISIGISEIISSIAFITIIDDVNFRINIILSYCISLSIMSFILYYYVIYIEGLMESFRSYMQEANRDFLTGLSNVRHFDKVYNSIFDNTKFRYEVISLLYIDIDYFKNVNDTYGHKEGDIVLKKVSEILTETCRNTAIVPRNGGEEFSVILGDCPPQIAMEIAERIRKTVEATPIELSNQTKISITLSIGVASYPNPVRDFNMLMERADMALYKAKHTGRNKVVFSS